MKEMESRVQLIQRSCRAFTRYRQILKTKDETKRAKELLELQHQVTANQPFPFDRPYGYQLPSTRISKNFRSIFFMDQNQIGPLCLPPKTGTTNWQRALTALYLNQDSDSELIDPATVFDQAAFSALPRFYSKYNGLLFPQYGQTMGTCIRDKLLERSENDSISWVITRHPFARLYSAWNQKFANDYSGIGVYKGRGF